MKKKLQSMGILNSHAKKTWLIMKITVILIVLSVFSSTASVYSQSARLNLKMKNTRIADVFDAIEQQSEFYFFYNRDYFDDNKKVDVNFKGEKIETVLDELFNGESVTYEIADRNILIRINKDSGISQQQEQQQEQQQQPKTIQGKVTNEQGESLPGVSIIIKGTTIGTVTNIDGSFILNIPDNAETLVFSFIGMRSEDVIIGDQSVFTITLKEDVIGIDEIVAIGYGVVKKSDLTGSVSTIKAEDLENVKMQSIDQGLAGRAAGVQVISSSGVPGSAPAVRILGTTSLQGANEPLYVIDGFPIYAGGGSGNTGGQDGSDNISGISNINPNDIASIEILKDASATAIYGARAA